MSATAAHGYTFRLALRHLLTGWTRPHVSLREAQSTGISEGRRIVLFAVSEGLYFALDPTVRSAVSVYGETVRQSSGVGDLALGAVILLATLSLLVLVSYMIECVVLYASLRICTRAHRPFATTRFLVAIGSWLVTVPASVAYCLGSLVVGMTSPALDGLSLPAWFAGAIGAPFAVLCVSEAAGVSLARSTVVVLIAITGCTAAYSGLDAGLECLNEAVRGFVPDEDFA